MDWTKKVGRKQVGRKLGARCLQMKSTKYVNITYQQISQTIKNNADQQKDNITVRTKYQ